MKHLQRARAWIDAHRYHGPRVNGTRSAGALSLTAVGLVSLATMFELVSANVLAVNFTTSDTEFKLYSNYIQGVSAGGMLAQNQGYSSTSQVGVAEIGIKTAKLAGLCAIATQSLGGVLGNVSLVLTAGATVPASFSNDTNVVTDGAGNPIQFVGGTGPDAGDLAATQAVTPISATDLFLNTNLLNGYGNLISGLNSKGNDTATMATADINDPTNTPGGGSWPAGQSPPVPGSFGLTAQHLNVGGLDGSSYGVNLAGNITLPRLRIQVKPEALTQSACPTSAS